MTHPCNQSFNPQFTSTHTTHTTHMSATITENTVSDAPVTTQISAQVSPTLLRSEIDERIIKIRPSSTPLDQISRMAGARKAGSMKVEYYSVDLKPGSVHTQGALQARAITKDDTIEINIDTKSVLSVSDTVLFPTIRNTEGEPIVGYVFNVDSKKVTMLPVNIEFNEDGEFNFPAIADKTLLVRMGRAAGELDVQTPQFATLPTKEYNLCQIFKAQIEESMLQRLSDKEVGWTFSDQEEVAILDMRMCMERTFLFGNKRIIKLNDGSDILLTGGIWNQTEKEFAYNKDALDSRMLINMMRKAFSDSNGSTRKVLLAGSGLIERLNSLEHNRVLSGNERVTKWGVDFDYVVSKFGSLYVARCEVFDLCGMEDYGMIVDPEYITKYSHVPFSAERISFHKQGVRNTEAVVLTEASCLVLRYPNAHMRIVPAPKN